ncbi:MAG: VOC family protein [Hyphomicrobiaceae bacterium]
MAHDDQISKGLQPSQQIVWVYTTDLDGTCDFYGRVLGLELARDAGNARIFKTTGQSAIGVCMAFEDRIVQPTGSMITLVTEEVDAWHAILEERGANLIGPPRRLDKFGIYGFFCRDPNGYVIEFQRFIE